jgi:hypothetical protein
MQRFQNKPAPNADNDIGMFARNDFPADQCGAGLYQYLSLDKHNSNPAAIEIENPTDFRIERETLENGRAYFSLTVEVPAEQFDDIAIAWVKHREIKARLNKYTLETLLTKCDFNKLITKEQFLDGIEDVVHTDTVGERGQQKELSANLEHDNIFEAISEDKDQAKHIKVASDKAIKKRNISELKGMFASQSSDVLENVNIAAAKVIAHIKAEQEISNEAALMSVVRNAIIEAIEGVGERLI